MKRIYTLLLVFVLGIALTGCFKLDFSIPNNLTPSDKNGDVPTSVLLESENKTHKLYVDETLQLVATVQPSTVTEPVIFISSNEEIATVDEEGLVTGISPGTVKITARVSKQISSNNTKTVEGYIILTVEEKPVELEAVSITGPDMLYVSEVEKYTLIKTPANAIANGTWLVDNDELATIDQNGRLTALQAGVVEVIYKVSDELQAVKRVEILDRTEAPETIEIVVREVIEVGEIVQAYIESTPRGSITEVEWTSSDEEIATIDDFGNIVGVNGGVVVIEAKYNDEIQATIEIEVIDNRINTEHLEDNLVDLVRTKKGSVLGVSNYKYNLHNDLSRSSIGSGFVYRVEFHLNDGSILHDVSELRTFKDVEFYRHFVITNRHVVEGSDALKVYLHEEDIEVDAKLIQYDDKEDIGVIYFDHDRYLRPLTLANSDELVSGRFAVAIGNPNGYEFSSTATFGIISHPKRYLPTDTDDDGINDWDAEYIQHDVAINPGNSGGPLFNLKGEVIGVNTLKYVSNNIESMGFSVPSNVVKNLIPYLENGERPVRAKLGVTAIAVRDAILNPNSDVTIPEGIETGLYVVEVSPGSVAHQGGIKADDIIITFNGIEVKNVTMLRTELNQIIVGSNVEIEVIVYRNGEYVTLTLIF